MLQIIDFVFLRGCSRSNAHIVHIIYAGHMGAAPSAV